MAKLTREHIVTIEVLQQRGQSQSQTARHPRRLRGGGPVSSPPRPRGGRRWPAEAVADRATRPGRGRRPLVAGPGRDPGPGAAAQRPAPPRLPPRRARLRRFVQVGAQDTCEPVSACRRCGRSAGSRRRRGPRPRATGASSRGSISATPTARPPSTPSSWCSATAARRPSSGVARWTSSPGITSTTRRTGGWAAWRRSTGSTTSRPASPGAAAPGE